MASNTKYPDVITYSGYQTYLADDLKTRFLNMFQGCRTSRRVIEKRDIPKDQYFIVKKKGALYEESTLGMRAKVLIKTEWVHTFVNREASPETSTGPRNAPPILEMREEEKFMDDEGNVYEVEMRGEEKTEDKVRFKGRDLERVFQIENLCSNVQLSHTNYIKEEDYEILLVTGHTLYDQLQVERGHKKRLYFTYQGLIKVIAKSRSGVAARFMHWLKHVVFVAHMGDDEAKANLAFELTETNPNVLKTFLSKCMSKMSC